MQPISLFFLDLKNINYIFIIFIKISILNAAFKPKFPVLDAALKPQSKNDKKACLMHTFIPMFLDFNAAFQYKVLRYILFHLSEKYFPAIFFIFGFIIVNNLIP